MKAQRKPARGMLVKLVQMFIKVVLVFYSLCGVGLLYLRAMPPLTTAVQIQRRLESLFAPGEYQKRYRFVPLSRISKDFQHAVIAAEDGRFYHHSGFDWREMRKVISEKLENGRLRGGSTITQQLVKNLYLTTHRSFIRKAFEYPLVPMAEILLSKDRILELYLNVAEWGPGVFGAEAAAQYYYRLPAARISREQGARLAAILPAPRSRRPERMDDYSAEILERMRRMGW